MKQNQARTAVLCGQRFGKHHVFGRTFLRGAMGHGIVLLKNHSAVLRGFRINGGVLNGPAIMNDAVWRTFGAGHGFSVVRRDQNIDLFLRRKLFRQQREVLLVDGAGKFCGCRANFPNLDVSVKGAE